MNDSTSCNLTAVLTDKIFQLTEFYFVTMIFLFKTFYVSSNCPVRCLMATIKYDDLDNSKKQVIYSKLKICQIY